MRMLRSNYFLLVLCVVGGALAVVAAYASCPNVTGVSIVCPSGGSGIIPCTPHSGMRNGEFYGFCSGGGSVGLSGNFGTAESSGSQITGYTYPICWVVNTCIFVPDKSLGEYITPGGTFYAGYCVTNTQSNPGTAFVSDSCPEM